MPTPPEQEAVIPSPTASPVPTPMPPVTYTVQAGDTLSGIALAHDVSVDQLVTANDIADPNVLQIGQTLVIQQGDATVPAAPVQDPATGDSPDDAELDDVEVPTLTPSGPPRVEIIEVAAAGDLTAEMVVLESSGGTVSLEGWTLSTATVEGFTFPALTLFPQAAVRVHSTHGENTPRDLFWGRAEAAWQPGELLTLRNAEGSVVDTYILPAP